MHRSNKLFCIGIPTINRADLLNGALRHYHEVFKDTRIIVVDNGNQADLELPEGIDVTRPPRNLGVAGSWNLLCHEAFNNLQYRNIMIANDDIILGRTEEDIRNLIQTWEDEDFFTTHGTWCVFILRERTWRKVGPFDEWFYPAYCEDEDYSYRMKLADCDVFKTMTLQPVVYRNSQTIARDPSLNSGDKSRIRYVHKWGGLPGQERFKTPFNKQLI